MKKLFKSVMAMMVVAMLFGACEMGKDEDPDEKPEPGEKKEINSGVDFTSTITDPAIWVSNNSRKNLVAFKSTLRADNLIGGIPAQAKNHGFKRTSLFGSTPQDFAMILITEEDYIEYKDDLGVLEDKPFTRVYIFYNGQGENTIVYEISGRLGGDYELVVLNPTGFNVELRLGGVRGETIGYAPTGKLSTTLFVSEGNLNIFPVFKRYNSYRDTVETLYPQGSTGYAWFQAIGFSASQKKREFNTKDAVDAMNGGGKRSSGVTWLNINRQGSGDVRLVMDDTPVITSTGITYFTGSRTFQIDMASVSANSQGNTTFSEYRDLLLLVGPEGFEVPIKDEDGKTTLRFYADKLYQVTVTGSHNNGDLTAVVTNMNEPQAVDLSTF